MRVVTYNMLITEIERRYAETGFAPTYAELADSLGYAKSNIHRMMLDLERDQQIVFHSNRKAYIPARWRQLSHA